MSKQQTPITAEEFLNNEVGKFVSLPEKEWWCKQMEQYAQAKALETLERKIALLEERRKNVVNNTYIKYFVKTAKFYVYITSGLLTGILIAKFIEWLVK